MLLPRGPSRIGETCLRPPPSRLLTHPSIHPSIVKSFCDLTLGPSDRQAGFCVGIQNQLDKFPAAVGATTATRKMITIAQFKQATSYKSETLITGQQTCPFDNRFTSPWQVSTPNRHTQTHTQKEKEKKREKNRVNVKS
jgi:hypothetical protein